MYGHELEEDEQGGLSGIRSWIKRWQRPPDEFEDEEAERPVATMSAGSAVTTAPGAVGMGTTIRLATMRESAITIMPASTFDDIQRAADRLKRGEAQIINLESTPPDMAERLIDFLNGVTYALDGSVDKVAEGAYLFTPATIAIREDGSGPAPNSAVKPPWRI
jgi:cell division inhibitor SepF